MPQVVYNTPQDHHFVPNGVWITDKIHMSGHNLYDMPFDNLVTVPDDVIRQFANAINGRCKYVRLFADLYVITVDDDVDLQFLHDAIAVAQETEDPISEDEQTKSLEDEIADLRAALAEIKKHVQSGQGPLRPILNHISHMVDAALSKGE